MLQTPYFNQFKSFLDCKENIIRLILLIVLIISLPVGIYLVQHTQIFKPKAYEKQRSGTAKDINKHWPEFLSNELLIKIKKETQASIKEGNPADTGLESLNSRFKKNKVKTFTRVVKEGKNSKKNQDIFLWYKLTFEGENKKITSKDPLADTIQRIKTDILSDQNIEKAEPNFIVTASLIPNDPYYQSIGTWGQSYPDLWGMKKINMEGAWQQTTGSDQVVVAVVDTGVDRNHEDIKDNIWVNTKEIPGNRIDDDQNGYVDDYYGWDWVNNDSDPIDDYGHGTHVSGTIAATGDNTIGVVGVNWKTKIMALKFLDRYGRGDIDNGAKALIYAADMGAKVSSNSWIGVGRSQIIEDALKYEHDKGIVIVVAAGNNNDDAAYYYPASSEYAITVAATDQNDVKASFSNWGEMIEVAAPGVDILSLRAAGTDMYGGGSKFVPPGDANARYYRSDGTSMATPHVAGLSALLLSKEPSLNNQRIRDILASSVADLGDVDFDVLYGYGRINAEKALAEYTTLKAPPRARITSPVKLFDGLLKAEKSIEIKGSATGDNFERYLLEWSTERSNNWKTDSFSYKDPSGTGHSPVVSGILGYWNPSDDLPAGYYTIRLTSYAGSKSAFWTAQIYYDPSLKLAIEVPCKYADENGSTPIVTDIDDDNYQEIITSCNGKLYVYSHNGELMFEKNSWMLPAVGDIDPGYKGKEIITLEYYYLDSSKTVWKMMAWHADGTSAGGIWPRELTFSTQQAELLPQVIMIEDLDKDGQNDILIAERSPYTRHRGSYVYALQGDGSDVPGFTPFNTAVLDSDYGDPYHAEHFVADVNGDLFPEIINREKSTLSVYDYTGKFLWKFEDRDEDSNLGSIAVGDLDQDNVSEILVVQNYGAINKYKWNGSTFLPVEVYQLPGASFNYGINRLEITDINFDSKPEIVLELHNSTNGYFKYAIIDQQGTVLTGFPGTPDIAFPSDPTSTQWKEYPWKWSAADYFIPTNVTFGKKAAYKIMAYEAMTFYDVSSGYMPNTYLEVFLYKDGSMKRANNFPKKIRDHWVICRPWTCRSLYFTPVMSDIDNNGISDIVTSVNYTSAGQGFSIYVFKLDGIVDYLDWPQYLHDERHTGNYTQVSIPTPVPSPSPTPVPSGVRPEFCLQVLTFGQNPKTGQCKGFTNSCLPPGWVKVKSCEKIREQP